jgi:hypothetical protein
MSDLDRLRGVLSDKERELIDFAADHASDVMTADVSDGDRGSIALGFLALMAKGRPQRQTITIEHRPEPKALEKPRPVVTPYVAQRVAGILETGILPEPAAPLMPETDMRAPSVAKRETLYSRIAAALAKHGNNRTLAAEEVGCDRRRVHNYCHMNGIKMPDGTDERRGAEKFADAVATKPIPAAGMRPDPPDRVAATNAKHPQYQKPPAAVAPKQRKCMTCTDPFLSEGSHNRMCTKCRHLSEGIAA